MKNFNLKQATVSAHANQVGVMPTVPAHETHRKFGTFDS